jgi:two-component system response regulator RegA
MTRPASARNEQAAGAAAAADSSGRTFLVVDDDDTLRNRMEKSLWLRGFEVVCAANFDEAAALAEKVRPDLAVLDLKMPGRSGLELLSEIRRISPNTRCVMLTGYGSIANAVEATKLGAVNYITKPADADQILAALDEVQARDTAEHIAPPSLAEAQWEHIQRVLGECGGNISEAARMLDIPRRTLQRKLKKLAP